MASTTDTRPQRVLQLVHKSDWDGLLRYLAGGNRRGELSERNENGMLPLHEALSSRAPLQVIQALIYAYLEGARTVDSGGRLPLHWALETQAPMEVVQALMDAYPEGVRTQDGNGSLPLHEGACSHNQASLEVVRALLDAYPEGVQTTDRDGFLPLHWAGGTPDSKVEVVRALLNAYPEGVRTQGNDGWLPLHFATEGLAPVEVIRVLLEAYPEAVHIQNNEGGQKPGRMSIHDDEHLPHLFDDHPRVHVMLSLARANHLPSRPWTPQTHFILRGIAACVPDTGASAFIDAHILRVRTLVLAMHRLGVPSALAPLLASRVFLADMAEPS